MPNSPGIAKPPLRARLRDSAMRLIRHSGGLSLVGGSSWRSRHLALLCYHGFSQDDEHQWHPSMYVPGALLEQRLRFLAEERYVVLPLGEGLRRLAEGTLPPRAVAITIDDGSYDFYALGYPIFRRAGIPVTVYVSTYYVFKQLPVFDVACAYVLWRSSDTTIREIHFPDGCGTVALGTEAGRHAALERIRSAATRLGWSADEKHHWLAGLAAHLEFDWQGFLLQRRLCLMNPAEVASLDPAIVDVQLHTHRHRNPSDRAAFEQELSDNRDALAACGFPPDGRKHFCYPSGLYDSRALPWLKDAGVVSAATGIPGLVTPRTNPLLLPRFIDTSTTAAVEFEGWVSGFRHVVRRPRRNGVRV